MIAEPNKGISTESINLTGAIQPAHPDWIAARANFQESTLKALGDDTVTTVVTLEAYLSKQLTA